MSTPTSDFLLADRPAPSRHAYHVERGAAASDKSWKREDKNARSRVRVLLIADAGTVVLEGMFLNQLWLSRTSSRREILLLTFTLEGDICNVLCETFGRIALYI